MTTEKGPTQADMESARLTYEMCESASFALGLSGVAPTPENVQAVQIRRIAIALAAAREQGRAEERDADKPLLRMLKEARDMNGIVDCTDAQGTMKVRRVLGTLPITADGCVVGDGARLYSDCGMVLTHYVSCSSWPSPPTEFDGWYSTRESAIAARGEA